VNSNPHVETACSASNLGYAGQKPTGALRGKNGSFFSWKKNRSSEKGKNRNRELLFFFPQKVRFRTVRGKK